MISYYAYKNTLTNLLVLKNIKLKCYLILIIKSLIEFTIC